MILQKMDVVYYSVGKSTWEKAKEFYSEKLALKQVFGSDEMGWIEYRVDEAHTTALAISLAEDDQVHPGGGGTVVFLVDNLEKTKKELEEKAMEFIGEIYADEMLKLIKFRDPAGNHLQLVEVLTQD